MFGSRGGNGRSGRRVAFLLALLAVWPMAGCRTSTRSGLPAHIRTVEVHLFQNKTMYKGVEGLLARGIIDRINADPGIRVVSNGGDAVITGEVKAVTRSVLRETSSNEPGTVLIAIRADFSFYDVKSRRYLMEDVAVSSSDAGISAGIFEASRGGESTQGERGAARALAAEIVRRSVGMW